LVCVSFESVSCIFQSTGDPPDRHGAYPAGGSCYRRPPGFLAVGPHVL